MTDSPSKVWDLTVAYRTGLRTMFNVVRKSTGGCSCNLRSDWTLLMDNHNVPARDPRLTTDGKNCLCCEVETVYVSAVGEDVYEAELLSEIRMQLGDHSVIVQTEDEDGRTKYQIVKRDALEAGETDPTD